MKFAHIADCHVGGWRDPKLREANVKAFQLAVENCLSVDFVLIAGDLFNTAVPGIDSLRVVVEQLKKLKDKNIPVYFIAGSHDFSPSGKTMLDVLAQAGLGVNVAAFESLPEGKIKPKLTVDPKTGVKIAGMIGKKGGLEKEFYYQLAACDLSGFSIFMFHSALAELKPRELAEMDSMPVSLLPKGFEYYAGGHVHVVEDTSIEGYKKIVFPGPTFPNSFGELEKLKQGSMVIVEDGRVEHVSIIPHPVKCFSVDAENKSAIEVEAELRELCSSPEVNDAIVTVRVQGCLKKGKPADIHWNDVFQEGKESGAYALLRNTRALTSKELEEIMIKEANVDEVEDAVLKEHCNQFSLSDNDLLLSKKLMRVLSIEKRDGEKVADYEGRLLGDLEGLFD